MTQAVRIKLNQKNHGFSTIEYTFLIVLVVSVLIGMFVYFSRAFQGRWKQSADSFGYGLQYEPNLEQMPAGVEATTITGSLGGELKGE